MVAGKLPLVRVWQRGTGLDLGGDLTFDGLEDDIDLDALLVCGACGRGQGRVRTAGTR